MRPLDRPAPRRAGWRLKTLKQTVVELGHPILFAKAIIILAFIPIFTFQRVEGKIFTPVALTLSFAMLGAVILTMTLVADPAGADDAAPHAGGKAQRLDAQSAGKIPRNACTGPARAASS